MRKPWASIGAASARLRARIGPTGATLAAAILFGLLAVLGIRGHLAEQLAAERERLAPRRPVVDVVVAKRDLPAGAVVEHDSMAVRTLPADALPGGAVRPDGFDTVVGARLAVPLRAGEPLLGGALAAAATDAFSGRVRAGVRALTIAVDEVAGLSGMLRPGDRIDLLLSARAPARGGQESPSDVTVPLMQDVPVLATGRQFRPGAGDIDSPVAGHGYTTITLEADPQQAQRLIVAQRSGRLTAMLRNPADRGAIDRRPLDIATLLGSAPSAPPIRPAMEVIVGGRGSPERRVQPADWAAAPPPPSRSAAGTAAETVTGTARPEEPAARQAAEAIHKRFPAALPPEVVMPRPEAAGSRADTMPPALSFNPRAESAAAGRPEVLAR